MNNNADNLILENVKYELTDAAYNFHLEPNEDTQHIELAIEFSFADVDQVLDESNMQDFNKGKNSLILPARTVIYFIEERGADEYSPFCEAQFIGLLVFSNNNNKINTSLVEFQNFILRNNHELSLLIWKQVREIFKLYIKDKHFPDPPETFEKQEN